MCFFSSLIPRAAYLISLDKLGPNVGLYRYILRCNASKCKKIIGTCVRDFFGNYECLIWNVRAIPVGMDISGDLRGIPNPRRNRYGLISVPFKGKSSDERRRFMPSTYLQETRAQYGLQVDAPSSSSSHTVDSGPIVYSVKAVSTINSSVPSESSSVAPTSGVGKSTCAFEHLHAPIAPLPVVEEEFNSGHEAIVPDREELPVFSNGKKKNLFGL